MNVEYDWTKVDNDLMPVDHRSWTFLNYSKKKNCTIKRIFVYTNIHFKRKTYKYNYAYPVEWRAFLASSIRFVLTVFSKWHPYINNITTRGPVDLSVAPKCNRASGPDSKFNLIYDNNLVLLSNTRLFIVCYLYAIEVSKKKKKKGPWNCPHSGQKRHSGWVRVCGCILYV